MTCDACPAFGTGWARDGKAQWRITGCHGSEKRERVERGSRQPENELRGETTCVLRKRNTSAHRHSHANPGCRARLQSQRRSISHLFPTSPITRMPSDVRCRPARSTFLLHSKEITKLSWELGGNAWSGGHRSLDRQQLQCSALQFSTTYTGSAVRLG